MAKIVKYSSGKKVEVEVLAEGFSNIFDDLSYEDALEKVNSKSSVVAIAKKVSIMVLTSCVYSCKFNH